MKSGLQELIALSLLAAFGCGLALAHDDLFFVSVFGGASAVTIIEAIRRLRWTGISGRQVAAILFIEHGALVMFWQCQQGLVAPASNWPLKLY
jgi:hypothetical protein